MSPVSQELKLLTKKILAKRLDEALKDACQNMEKRFYFDGLDHFVTDENLFKAINSSRKMIADGIGGGIANWTAAKNFNVNKGAVAHHVGKLGWLYKEKEEKEHAPKDPSIMWKDFISKIERNDDPLVLSLFTQSKFEIYRDGIVTIKYEDHLKMFIDLLAQARLQWEPILSECFPGYCGYSLIFSSDSSLRLENNIESTVSSDNRYLAPKSKIKNKYAIGFKWKVDKPEASEQEVVSEIYTDDLGKHRYDVKCSCGFVRPMEKGKIGKTQACYNCYTHRIDSNSNSDKEQMKQKPLYSIGYKWAHREIISDLCCKEGRSSSGYMVKCDCGSDPIFLPESLIGKPKRCKHCAKYKNRQPVECFFNEDTEKPHEELMVKINWIKFKDLKPHEGQFVYVQCAQGHRLASITYASSDNRSSYPAINIAGEIDEILKSQIFWWCPHEVISIPDKLITNALLDIERERLESKLKELDMAREAIANEIKELNTRL